MTPAAIGLPPDDAASHLEDTINQKDSHRVLVVDDAEDLRMLLRARMETRNGLTVVGEAADGLAAVELASELHHGTGAIEPRKGATYFGRIVSGDNPGESSISAG